MYKNGVLENVTSVDAGKTVTLNVSGTPLYVYVPTTFAGIYAYDRWAKIQLFSNLFNVSSGKNFNSQNPNWLTSLRWTSNQSSAGTDNFAVPYNAALQSIIIYGNSTASKTLLPGQSLTFIQNPAVWKATFVGDQLGAPGSGNSNYDPLSMSTQTMTSGTQTTYSNLAYSSTLTANGFAFNGVGMAANTVPMGSSTYYGNATAITEPVNLFTVSSSLPTAFTVSGASTPPSSSASSVSYNLDTYALTQYATVNSASLSTSPGKGVNVMLSTSGWPTATNYITTSNPLRVIITGYSQGSQTSVTAQFTGNPSTSPQYWAQTGTVFDNITNVQLNYPLPNPGVTVTVYDTANTANTITSSNAVQLAALTYKGPTLEYQVPQHSYYIASAIPATTSAGSANVLYTGESGAQTTLSLQASTPSSTTTGRFQYFTFNVPEITQPATSVPNANVIIGITNQSTTNNPGGALYWLNYTGGNSNAVQYESSQNQIVKAQAGFRTERGSQLASISQTSLTYDMAKSVDTLQFVIGPASSNVTTTTATYGPFGVGAATNLPNVTIANVTAKCVTSGPSVCNVTGLSNLTATPSVTHATTPVVLNTATNPIAVLDTNANNASSLIVVGSKYVNSVAAQIFQNQPALDSAFGPTGADSVIVNTYGNKILVAGYTAQQTVQAGNEFIQQLLQSAST